ncbi:hypothetical protein [Limnobacter parvus]|uniref:Uncharacterized protein n=1 Tax=Limnobacter parvus TaxID=2939690 RepID=A0ABT1XCP9_9BURK|nr:hypothetical protein [Limnobacter parvus]MCR2745061.1 hypothetical protein [Limnobacter parvus]
MKVFGFKFLNTSAVDGLGFNQEKIRNAVTQTLNEHLANNHFSTLVQSLAFKQDEQCFYGPGMDKRCGLVIDYGNIDQGMEGGQVGRAYVDVYARPVSTEFVDCAPPDQATAARIDQVLESVNKQLRDWGMPNFQFINKLPQEIPGQKQSDHYIDVSSCAKVQGANVEGDYVDRITQIEDKTAGEQRAVGQASIQLERSKTVLTNLIAHEFAHTTGSHPHETLDLKKVNPDVLQFMCEPISTNTKGSQLIFDEKCMSRQYDPNILKVLVNAPGQEKWGEFELATLRSVYANTPGQRTADFNDSVQRIVNSIRENYGQKVASQAMAAFCATACTLILHHGIDQLPLGQGYKQVLKNTANIFSSVMRLAILHQSLTSFAHIYSTGFLVATLGSNTLKSLAHLLGAAGMGQTFLSLIRGNSDAMVGMLFAFGGSVAGRAFAETVNTLVSKGAQRSPQYFEKTCMAMLENTADTEQQLNFIQRHLPDTVNNSIALIGRLDNSVAEFVNKYCTLNFLYSKLLNAAPAASAAVASSAPPTAPPVNPETVPSRLEILESQAIELAIIESTHSSQLAALADGHATINQLNAASRSN